MNLYYDAVTEAVCKFNNYNLKDDSIQNNINISYVIGCNYIKIRKNVRNITGRCVFIHI